MSRLTRDGVARWVQRLNRWLPKRDAATVSAMPGFYDMVLPVVAELDERRVPVTWLERGAGPPIGLDDLRHVRIHRYASLAGVWAYVRSKYVFFTHSLYGVSLPESLPPPTPQISVNLWHGMPIKKIGRAASAEVPKATFAIATSPLFQELIAEAWGMPKDRVLITGQPWNDRLLTASEPDVIDKLGFGGRLVIWLPTWRRGLDGSVNGRATDSVFGMESVDLNRLALLLAEHDAHLVVKPHPFAQVSTSVDLLPDRVHVIDEDWIAGRDLTLFSLLAATHCLITDVSSVAVDYLLLDRPIIFAMEDLEEYEATRGTYFDLKGTLPGPMVSDFESVLGELELALEEPERDGEKRSHGRKEFHTHRDSCSTSRLLDQIGLAPDASRVSE